MSDPAQRAAASSAVTVWIPAQLRGLTGGQGMVRVSGGTVREVIAALDQLYPGMKARLCAQDSLRPGLVVAVGTQVATLGLLQPVPEGSEVHFLPAVAGGQAGHGSSECRVTRSSNTTIRCCTGI